MRPELEAVLEAYRQDAALEEQLIQEILTVLAVTGAARKRTIQELSQVVKAQLARRVLLAWNELKSARPPSRRAAHPAKTAQEPFVVRRGRVQSRSGSAVRDKAVGRYFFSGTWKGRLDSPHGLRWQIICLTPLQKAIAETPTLLGDSPNWTKFSMRFDVPSACGAQMVRLAAGGQSALDVFASSSLAFADLKLSKDDEHAN